MYYETNCLKRHNLNKDQRLSSVYWAIFELIIQDFCPLSPNTWSGFLWFLGDRIRPNVGWLARISVAPPFTTWLLAHQATQCRRPGLIVRTESRPVLSSTISGHQLANVGFKHWKRRTTRLCFSERTTKKSSTKTFLPVAKGRVLVK